MIVIHSQDLTDTERHARGPGWESRRMIVKRDGIGYSVHETRVFEGAELHCTTSTTTRPTTAWKAKARCWT